MKSYILIPTRKSNSSSSEKILLTVNDQVCKITSKQQCNKKQIPIALSTMLISIENFKIYQENTKLTPEYLLLQPKKLIPEQILLPYIKSATVTYKSRLQIISTHMNSLYMKALKKKTETL